MPLRNNLFQFVSCRGGDKSQRAILQSHVVEPMSMMWINNLFTKSQKVLKRQLDLLQPVRQRLDNLEIQNPQTARLFCKMIPAQCPFERDIKLFGRLIAHIPPLCKLNPLYEQLVGLRFRALCYLVDQCGEDIQSYC